MRYAAAMDAYLTDFWARTQPLVPLEPLLAEPLRAFEKSYAEKNQTNGEALDLRTFRTVTLEALGLDRLNEPPGPGMKWAVIEGEGGEVVSARAGGQDRCG